MTDEEIDLIASRIRNDMRKRIEFCDNVGITLDDYYVKKCGDFEIEDMVRAFENGKVIDEEENNKLLDVINNQDVKIADLEKKVKEYEQQLSAMEKGVCDVCKEADADYYEKQIADLEKKVGKLQKVNCEGLAELNHYNGELIIEVAKKDKQIEQAKEMLRMIIHSYNHKERFSFEKDLAKAAQFLEGQ